MTIEEAVYGLLTADANVAVAIGTRLYPDEAPQNAAYPFIVYSQADRKSVMTMAGPVALDSWGMTLEVQADSKASARRTALAVRGKLNGFHGEASGLSIRGIFDDSESGSLEIPQDADERGVWSISMGFTIWYRQL